MKGVSFSSEVTTVDRVIYADNAATTQLDREAFDAMLPWLQQEFGNASQRYSFAKKPKEALAKARETIASCINANPEEIFFTSGGTESDNWAIKSSALYNNDHSITITSAFEHHAIIRSCTELERLGYPVMYLYPSADGYILPETLNNVITEKTRMVSIMFANNEIGSIQSIKELCSIAHSKKALFHTDAVQAVGHISIDVKDLDVDMLSASAHKFNGPKGIGFLYIKKGVQISPYIHGGSQEFNLRAGTENIAAIVGMSVALKHNIQQIHYNQSLLSSLEERFLNNLRDSGVPFIRNGGQNTLPGLISLSFPNKDGEAIFHRMDLNRICISTGAACNSKETEISHVLQAIKLDSIYANGTIRISLGKNNSIDDVEKISNAIIKCVR